MTADLVGRDLFQDEDFVKHLSVNHRTVFQWLRDEVKHLSKLVTAGSKEARQLEKVKHAFEEAYRAGGKAQTGTQYSVSYTTENKPVAVIENDIFKGEFNELSESERILAIPTIIRLLLRLSRMWNGTEWSLIMRKNCCQIPIILS